MDVTASTITIVNLAFRVKRLIQDVKQQAENAKELEDKADTLATILREASSLCGPDGHHLCSPNELRIRQTVEKVVVRCGTDLKKFAAELDRLLSHKNWFSLAWRQQYVAPALSRIDKSIAEHLQHLSVLVHFLQRVKLHQMHEIQTQMQDMLQMLARTSLTDISLSTTGETQVADADSMISQVTVLIEGKESKSQEDLQSQDLQSEEVLESNTNGISLLEAILNGDNDAFDFLLLDGDTSLKEKDDKGRTPLLLAAHLGKGRMVKRLLTVDTIHVPRDSSTDDASSSSTEDDKYAKDTKTTNHREIGLNATDKLGRTTLHYCAEFGMCDEAEILLDHKVDVNARENNNLPPAYYAAKNRKYDAMKLLLARGATTDFELPISTPLGIKKLLEKPPSDDQVASISRHRSSGQSGGRPPLLGRTSSSIIRRWSSAKG
ncbi:MAG: hypothetical protein Q9225_002970 [Loekoesia sp. 1 TL-2023]